MFKCIHYTCLYIIGRVSKSKLDKEMTVHVIYKRVFLGKTGKGVGKAGQERGKAIVTQVSDFKSSPLIL